MGFHFPFNWFNKFGTIPSDFREAMSYEEQILWLCKAHQDLQSQFDSFKLSIDTLQDDVENLQSQMDSKQGKLVAGENIYFDNLDISAYLNFNLNDVLETDKYIDLSGDVGDVVDTTPLSGTNTSYVIVPVKVNEEYFMLGTFTLAKTDFDNKITLKFEQTVPETTFTKFKVLHEGKLMISWYDTDKNPAYFAQSVTPEYVINTFNSLPQWVKEERTEITEEISQDSTNQEIPTAEAVYNAIRSGGEPDYEGLSNKPQINGVTLEGDLTTEDLNIDSIPLLEDDFNVWELDSGLYKVAQNVVMTYGTGTMPNENIEIQNEIALLYVGKYNSFYINFTLFDKEANQTEFSSAIFQGHSEIVDSSNVNGFLFQTLSPDTPFEFTNNRVTWINNTSTNYTYPTSLAVYNYVSTEIGNISTILQNINTGTGVS